MDQNNVWQLSQIYQGVLFPELEGQGWLHQTGLLPSQQIRALIHDKRISSRVPIEEDQIQPASLDLRLGPVGYKVRASFLPGQHTKVMSKVQELSLSEIDLTRPCVLDQHGVYIVPLLEELALPRSISAKANPKSTTGRLDVFTRLIADYSREFERVEAGYKGPLYVEIVPRSFSIVVTEGSKLNQLRFLKGVAPSSNRTLDKLAEQETLVYSEHDVAARPDIDEGLWIRVDLAATGTSGIVGYKAKPQAPPVDLRKLSYYEPEEFWEPIYQPRSRQLILNPDDFYILASKHRIRIPNTAAAAMVPYDPSVGEFRIHYAGFFDPGFGYGSNDLKGTRAVLEVRSHEVPFLMEDGQVVGRLIYERLLETPDKVYGKGIGSSYQSQGVALSKQFKPFQVHSAALGT